MTAAPLKPARSIFTNLIAALTLGPAALVIIIGLWSSYDIARSIRAELINQINDDVAALTEVYIGGGQAALLRAVAQREALSPINRSGASYLVIAPSGESLGGSLTLGSHGRIDMSQPARIQSGDETLTIRATQLRGGERLIAARDHSPVQRAVRTNALRFAGAVLALLLMSYILAKRLSGDLRARVNNMNRVFKTVGGGTLDARLKDDCKGDELSLLGGNINR